MSATDPFTSQDRADLVEAAAAVAESGLVVGSSGNLSLRRDNHLLITPRRARLGVMDPADCVCVSLDDGAVAAGHARASDSEPSSETPLHRAVYAAVPSAGAVVHTHSHFATVLSTLVTEIPTIHYVAATFGGAVRVAPYATFGSPELAASVLDALEGRTAALMANHGAVTTGADLEGALRATELLEWACTVYWRAAQVGQPRVLSEAQRQEVVDYAVRSRYGSTRGVDA
jgi:L-fuculose-phosphate aldolase